MEDSGREETEKCDYERAETNPASYRLWCPSPGHHRESMEMECARDAGMKGQTKRLPRMRNMPITEIWHKLDILAKLNISSMLIGNSGIWLNAGNRKGGHF
jgi:hypothetical protein